MNCVKRPVQSLAHSAADTQDFPIELQRLRKRVGGIQGGQYDRMTVGMWILHQQDRTGLERTSSQSVNRSSRGALCRPGCWETTMRSALTLSALRTIAS